MGAWHPSGRARVSVRRPESFGICDRCNFQYNLHDLKWQFQWAGMHLQNIRLLVCSHCFDTPNQQLRSIILPPDPLPVFNPRPERYSEIVPSFITTEDGVALTGEDGVVFIDEIQDTPTPSPELPVIYPLVPGPYS